MCSDVTESICIGFLPFIKHTCTWCLVIRYAANANNSPIFTFISVALQICCNVFTGWAVALTCCISHSAKYRKTANFDPPRKPKPMYRFAWNLTRLITSATPPDIPNLMVVAQRMWSRHMREISHLCFFSFLFCFLHHAYKLHFLTDLYDLYVKWRLFGQGCAFLGLNDNWPLLGGRTPKKSQCMHWHWFYMLQWAELINMTSRATGCAATQAH